MTDTYQAVYDAIRSRFHGCDTDTVVRNAVQDAFSMANHHMACVAQEYCCAARDTTRPHVLYRLTPFQDGDHWCVLLGDDLQVGIVGFGETPMKACHDFDKNFGWVG